jgi:hypothetical protein
VMTFMLAGGYFVKVSSSKIISYISLYCSSPMQYLSEFFHNIWILDSHHMTHIADIDWPIEKDYSITSTINIEVSEHVI